jgi:hypothetical protein
VNVPNILPLDEAHVALVVIPTVAFPNTLIPTFARIASDAEARAEKGLKPIALVLAVNTPDPASANDALHGCEGIAREANLRHPGCLDITIWRQDKPIGFGAANNRGLMAAIARWGGVPELVVFHNDDAHVPHGWLDRMLAALKTDVVHGYSEPWNPEDLNSQRQPRSAAIYGRIGMVGPISNLVAGIQQATAVVTAEGMVKWEGHVEPFDRACQVRYAGQRVTADFLSGFCVGFGRECLSDLMLAVVRGAIKPRAELTADDMTPTSVPPEIADQSTAGVIEASQAGAVLIGPWDEIAYPIAGYEDNDVCVRAELAGWRCIVAADTFIGHVGHQTFDRLFPEALRGLRNRSNYYARWRALTSPDRELRLAGAYRLKFEVGHDVILMRQSLARAARVCDSIAIVLTDNPLAVREDIRWPAEEAALPPSDLEMLQACSGAEPEAVCEAVRAWAEQILVNAQDSRIVPEKIRVVSWTGDFNERDERNASHALAEELGADWILSIDHDEVLEDRLARRHFEKLMRHPDPLVREYDQEWVNHWDSIRLAREDRPWGDDGTYVGGMHGFRMWRVPRRLDGSLVAPRRIQAGTANGLHCGNSPDHDLSAKRVSGVRFRHFGYLRVQDRHRKRNRYRQQDPDSTADRILTGAEKGRDPYGHLIHEEGMRVSPFSPINGIGLHILVHAGEKVEDLARLLDWLYGIVDRIVLVWTDPWSDENKWWLAPGKPAVVQAVADQDERRRMWLENGGREAGLPEPVRLRAAQAAQTIPTVAQATGPSPEFARMAAWFGAEWIHQPLEDNLAAARNAGLEALGADAQGIGWSLFLDLDEHFSEPFANMVAVRRAAECTDAHGFVWTFRNHHRGIPPSQSESIRMARLVPEMRLSSRVHETFDLAIQSIRASGQDVLCRPSPFLVEHIGLNRDDDDLGRKLRRYQRMLLLELEDNPYNSSAWVSLALHEFNDGRNETGLECLQRAVACAGDAYLGFRELAFHHLRTGQALLAGALERSAPGHDFYRAYAPLVQVLGQHVPTIPILGSAQKGVATTMPIELPPFPIPIPIPRS